MSWKKFLSAGLLCALASPAFATLPDMQLVAGGNQASNQLNANGDWVWKVQIKTSNPIPTGSTPLAAELGFKEVATNGLLVDALRTDAGTSFSSTAVFDTVNPGNKIFNWEVNGTGTNNNPEGLQKNVATNEVFAALGSSLISATAYQDYIEIITRGPADAAGRSLTTSVQTVGAYPVDAISGNGSGRIAELLTATTSANYDTFGGAPYLFTRTALSGDANLDGHRNGLDTGIFLTGFNVGTGKWYNGDFNGDGVINGLDTGLFLTGFNLGPPGSGAGLGGGSAVPEPASIALIGLALLGGMGIVRRKK